ncbi:long-chain fatty acid transport protein [Escherichia coli]|uniref:Long-chain fatty acid transport protein n=1 Tax=Escherichia coli TaxID=562 RepID=A0A376TW55_ECOLX|nr:long-chain fatty acid transport protein [Escherichia coli]
MNLNLSGAYRLNNAWSFGLGFNAVYARAKIERFAGDLGQLVAGQIMQSPAGQTPQGQALAATANGIDSNTKIAHLNGNQWGFGWNAGILYELDKNNRYALTYRSEVKIDFKVTTAAILIVRLITTVCQFLPRQVAQRNRVI